MTEVAPVLSKEIVDLLRAALDGTSGSAQFTSPQSGLTHWMTAVPLFGSDGGVSLAMLLAQDITERVQAESALRLESAITANMAEGACLVRARDGVIVYANATFEGMFGYDTGELDGVDVAVVNAPTDVSPEETAVTIMGALERQGRWSGEVKNLRKDGTAFWCRANVAAFEHDEHGTVWVAVHEDITQRRRIEEERERAIEEAHERAEEARQANEVKDQFLSRMSHELRTPLNSVVGFAELLDGEVDGLPRERARMILAAGRHLTGLVDDVLDFGRLQTGQLGLSPDALDLQAVIQDVRSLMAPLTDDSGDIVVRGDRVGAKADHLRTRQILVNLIDNARKYGAAPIVVEVRDCDGEAVVSIEDSGPGIPASEIEQAFEPFARLEGRHAGASGTGLGLSLSRALAEAMDGRLELTRHAPQGARFELRLPSAPCPTTRGSRPPGRRRRSSSMARARSCTSRTTLPTSASSKRC